MDKGSILLIDDSKAVLAFLGKEFSEAGYTVFTANNGRKGWDMLQSQPVDLIISDIEMPEMDGLDLCNRVKESRSYKEIYFIILTSHKDFDEKIKGLTIGADDYVEKTTRLEEILARVRAGMRIRYLQKELINTSRHMHQQENMASIGRLASGLAHEINNPASLVTSNLSVLNKYLDRLTEFINAQSDEIPEQQREKIDILKKKLEIEHIKTDAKSLISESLDGIGRITEIVMRLKNLFRS